MDMVLGICLLNNFLVVKFSVHTSYVFCRKCTTIKFKSNQIKSNQILFKVSNVHLKEYKISKKLFSRLYSITNNNKLYICFKYFGTSL